MNNKILKSLNRLQSNLAKAPASVAVQDMKAICQEVHRANQQEKEVRDILGMWMQLWVNEWLFLGMEKPEWNMAHMGRLMELSRQAVPNIEKSKVLIRPGGDARGN